MTRSQLAGLVRVANLSKTPLFECLFESLSCKANNHHRLAVNNPFGRAQQVDEDRLTADLVKRLGDL